MPIMQTEHNFILLYIDPGTGSMLFTVVLGLLGTVVFFFRGLILKLKSMAGGAKGKRVNSDKLPIVIYSDHKRYWNVFKPICDEFERRKQKIVYMTQSDDDPVLNAGYEYIEGRYIGAGNRGFSVLNLLNAGIVFSTTPGLDVLQWKRSKYVDRYIHIFHGASNASFYKMFGIDYYDSVLISGEFQRDVIRKLESLRNLPEKKIGYSGIPYMDDMVRRLEGVKHEANQKPLVLLAPSWGPNSILVKYGEEFIDALVATGYTIVIRPHPQSYTADKAVLERLKKTYPDTDSLSWNSDNDNFDILERSDIMISDYSGVILDYTLVFDKPVIYTAPDFDRSTLDCAWLDEIPWVLRTLPKIGHELSEKDLKSIKSVIDECLNSDRYEKGREEVRDEVWLCRGTGAVSTVDYIMQEYEELENLK